MKTSNQRYVLLALIATSLLYTGCQKAAPSSVRAKKGVLQTSGNRETTQSDKKLDELVKEGKTLPVCTKGILEKNTALTAELEATLKVIEDGKSKKTAEVDQSIEAHLSQIKALVGALYTEFFTEDIASCGSGKDQISIESLRNEASETYIAIADAIGKDSPESLAARAKKKDKEKSKASESLVDQKLKLAKELIVVLDEQNQRNSLFIAEGKFGSTKENYQKALDTADLGVCLLEKAPAEKLKEEAVLTILKAEVTATEVSVEVPKKDIAVKKTLMLLVQASSGDQVLQFNCRLGKSLKQQSAAEQFLKIFGALLIDQSATSNLN